MDRGLTQRTLAERLGCRDQTEAAWERNESEPLSRRWPAIEGVLGPMLLCDRQDLPSRIRAARLRLGMTQEELARRARLDVRTIRNVERGIYRPFRTTKEKLDAVLGSDPRST